MDVSLELFREYNIYVVIYLKLLQMLYINFFFFLKMNVISSSQIISYFS